MDHRAREPQTDLAPTERPDFEGARNVQSMPRLLLLASPLFALLLLLAGCPEAEREPAPREPPQPAANGELSQVVEQALPAIVSIEAEALPPEPQRQRYRQLDLPDEPVSIGVGSGVLFRHDGHILTNNHVVQDAHRVLVVLHDRRYFEAEVVGRDPSTEVAVVKIPGNDFPVATLGDSDALALGDRVLALGSPLGLEFSVTAGVVSGTGRAVGIIAARSPPEPGQAPAMEHFIQTDAPLSLGNSGGPLLNTAGEVVGINTAIAAPPGVPASIGFAIPSNLAGHVAEQLIEHGQVTRAFLGVSLTDMTADHAREHGFERVEGAVVRFAEPGSPGALAGLREGDVILGIGEERVQTVSDLQVALAWQEPGAIVELVVARDGYRSRVPVRLGSVSTRAPT